MLLQEPLEAYVVTWGPLLGLRFYCGILKILSFLTSDPTFSFCAGPHKLHSWACRHGCLLPCFLQIFIWVSSLQRGLFWIPRLKPQPQPQPGSLAPFLAVFSSRVCLFLSYCTFDYSVCYLPSMKARVFVCLVHSCIPPVVLKVPGTEPCPVSIC